MAIEIIPKQLQNPNFRFILLKEKSKVPIELDWQNTKNYSFDDPKLKEHVGNIGVVGGYGNLRILDVDDKDFLEEIKGKMPKTFVVKTGSGGKHFYFLSDYDKNHVLLDGKGELRANNYQVVVPGSIHPTGNKYEVIEDNPIIKISKEKIRSILEPYLRPEIIDIKIDKNKPKDESRSGREFREVIKLIGKGKTKEEVFKEMEVYAKWISAPPQYRELTYEKAKKYVESQKIRREEHKFIEGVEIFERLKQAKEFIKIQPLFYDDKKFWWLWNFKTYCYESVDEIDILNKISRALGLDTTKSATKTEILNALQQKGREYFRNIKQPKKSWVQFKDVIVDVKTGEQFEATPKYFVTNPVPFKIGESEDTPTMDRLFKEWVVMDGVQDESYVDTLYEMIAYSTLQHQFLQRLFALQGVGSNGKGCFLRILTKFLGENNICMTELKLLTTKQFEASSLYKKQACLMGEVDTYDMKNTNLLKQLTGEDKIRYEFKGKTPFTESSNTTCFIATNALPVTPDQSIAYYRRWLIVDFPHIFKVGRDVVGEIPNEEYENLARKCIRICKGLYKKMEFTNEGTMEERMKRYEERSNPLMRFIETKCEEDPAEYIIFGDFHKKFCEYLKENRLRVMTKIRVSKSLRNEGFQIKDRKVFDENGEEIHTTCVYCLKWKKEVEEWQF